MIEVTLSREELQQVAEWGTARTEENKYSSNIADYDTKRFNLNSEQANRLGVMVEFAVYKWLGYDPTNIDLTVWAPFVPKSEYAQHLNRPDIAGKYEVRRANRRNNPLPIRTKDVIAEAILIQGFVDYHQNGKSISVPHKVELTGWAVATEDWHRGTIPSWSKGDARVVTPRELNGFRCMV